MDYKEFMTYFDSKGTSKKEAIVGLQNYVNEFPYFQTAQSLLAKALHEQEHVKYDKQLKIAAAYCGDRRSLYNLINHRPSSVFVETTSASPFISHSPQSLVVEEIQPTIETKLEESKNEKNIFASEKGGVENYPSQELPLGNFNYIEEEESGTTYQSYSSGILIAAEDLPKMPTDEKTDAIEKAGNVGQTEHAAVEQTPILKPSQPKAEEKIIITEEAINIEDPREIIRQRLKEILGPKDSSENELPTIEVTGNKVDIIPVEEIVVKSEMTPIVSNKKIEEAEQITTPISADREQINIKTASPVRSFSKAEEIINQLSKDSENVKDDVAKGEFEYALETTIIDSLEKLPILDHSKAETPREETKQEIKNIPSSEFSFYDWLKKSSTNDFGKVEEVHAYDTAKTSSSIERPSDRLASELNATVETEKQLKSAEETIENSEEPEEVKNETEELINKFIATEPRIVASKAEFYNPAKQAQRSIVEDEDLVSETLAKIYSLQGAHLKARSSYQKLILLHPEKKAYFAALIEEIDNNYNNPNKQDL